MARHFIVLFYAREGSSPIIEHFENSPHVSVPLFEELDWFARQDIDENQIHHVLAKLLSSRELSVALEGWTTDRIVHRPLQSEKTGPLGFKWRIWGNPENVCSVLKQESVILFHLFRSRLLDYAMSRYMNDVYLPTTEVFRRYSIEPGSQLQFVAETHGEAVREALKKELRDARPLVDVEEFIAIATRYVENKEWVERTYLQRYRALGGSTACLTYENFQDDERAFFTSMCAKIGVPSVSTQINLQKMGTREPIEQALNKDELVTNLTLRDLQTRLDRLIVCD